MSLDEFNDDQKQYLQGFVSGAELAGPPGACRTFAATLGLAGPERRRATATARPASAEAVPTGPDAVHDPGPEPDHRRGQEALPQEEYEAEAVPARHVGRRGPARRRGAVPQGGRRPGLQVPRAVLRRPGPGLVHVPAADARRHRSPSHQFRGVARIAEECGGGYADVTTRANLQIREIPADDGRGRADGAARPGHRQPRLRGRQHPQRHRQPDRRHRPAGADRHPAAAPGRCTTTSSTTARCTACRASSTSPSTAAGPISALEDTNDIGFTAVRVGEGKVGPGRASTSGCSSAASPGTRTSPATRACCSRPTSASRSPRRSSASSSSTATGPTARRPGSSTCSTAGGIEKFVEETEKHLPVQARRASRWTSASRGRRSTSTATSASTRRSSRGCSTSASCCRSAG